MRRLGIFGAGGLGREVLELANVINEAKSTWSSIFFISDYNEKVIQGVEVIPLEIALERYGDEFEAFIAVGEPTFRKKIYDMLSTYKIQLATLIHPGSYVSATCSIGKGVMIGYGDFISSNVEIRDNVIVQPNSNIGYDTIIGEHCVVSSFCCLEGENTVESEVYIGFESGLVSGCSIGEASIISAHSLVNEHIGTKVIAMGNPARVIRKNDSQRVFK